MDISGDIKQEFEAVVRSAYQVSADMGQEVEQVFVDGLEHPLSREEATRLLTKVISVLKRSAERRGDTVAAESIKGDMGELVEQVMRAREQVVSGAAGAGSTRMSAADGNPAEDKKLQLVPRNDIKPRPVFPTPIFHGKEIPMMSGFVKTTDIELWNENERLDIHLKQFRSKEGREPSSQELLDIMLSRMDLPGVTDHDQFEIVDLARSIAINGVRKPPVLDTDGTLLDGNRRVTACHYVLNSDEFSTEEKKRAEYVFVWQLTEHAKQEDRDAVVTSLNFEPDYKQDWPEYVKARKITEKWAEMVMLEPMHPNSKRAAQLKRELSANFALGPDTTTVNRYLKMVGWADEFEGYHVDEKRRDEFEVQHRANKYFQYFDELGKGANPGGVAYALGQDETFKRAVFDLLFEGRFNNWREIRELKYVHDNPEARETLLRATKETDPDVSRERLEAAIDTARVRRAEVRSVGANTRIETFVKWLEDLPLKAVRDDIKPRNLLRLREALRLVDGHIATVLKEAEDDEA